MFLNPNIFFPIWILIALIYYIWEISRNKLKKRSVTKNCSTFHCLNTLFFWSQNVYKFSAFSLEFQTFFSRSLEQFFLTVGQNNFGNKIPFLLKKLYVTQLEKFKFTITSTAFYLWKDLVIRLEVLTPWY